MSDSIENVVSVSPSDLSVVFDETFNIDVYCVPGQLIKSFEFRLSFDPSLLQVDSIVEGDIFNGYSTFFNSGTIDNVAGSVVDVYGLIIGSGSVDTPGSLANITFTAQFSSGSYNIDLYDVGLTNETDYVNVVVNNGSVSVSSGNSNPNIPSTPSGPISRLIDVSGTYSTSAMDPDGDQVQYRFDWDASGSHDYSAWTTLGASGHIDSLSHSWSSPGTYLVKTQARDEHLATSSWSSGLTVTVSSPSNNDPLISNPNPVNESSNIPITTSSISVYIEDPDGDLFDYIITTSPDVGSVSINDSVNGSKTCTISGLSYSTKYTCYVSCRDTVSGNWINRSYWFNTVSSGGGGGFSYSSDDDDSDQNNPPITPVRPFGPLYVEKGVEYIYRSMSYDVDGDDIRYRFDWGDGNISDWSDFYSSNVSVSMSHHWSSVSRFEVRVIAQDVNGLNSSWSFVLNVTVSQTYVGDPPVAEINVSSDNLSVNHSVVFDGSNSYDGDGIIVSYHWDFGDGFNGSGVSPEHVYSSPGEYFVTLVVMDNNGNFYSDTLVVNVGSEMFKIGLDENNAMFPLFVVFGITILVLVVIVCLALFFKNNIILFIRNQQINNLRRRLRKYKDLQ